MTIPETLENDLNRIARGETLAPTADAENTPLLEAARRLSDSLLPLRQAPPGVRDRLEARLLNQLPEVARRKWQPVQPLRPLRRWQAVVGLATAAALVRAIIGIATAWGGSSGAVSAQVILDRAEAASTNAALSGVTSYHLRATRQVPAKGNTTLTQETWYAGSDRQRVDMQVKDASGAIVTTDSTVFNGAEGWNASTEANGQTRVIHTTGTEWSQAADLPSAKGVTSLADLIAQYSGDKACMNAHQQGDATVAGRAAYIILLTPKTDGCPGEKRVSEAQSTVESAKAAGAAATKRAGPGGMVGQLTVWVDKETFLPLKNEYRDTMGVVMDRYEVTNVEYDVPIPASVFTYVPPAGANVLNFNGVTPQDVKATISAADSRANGASGSKRP